MNLNADFEKCLEDNCKEELEWLEQEFEYLFKQKMLKHCYTKDDISIGTQILDNVIDSIKKNKSEQLLNLLAMTLNSIEKQFPEFF